MTNQESPDQENTVTILLLGDPGCGKTTFLSALKQGRSRLNGNDSHSQAEPLRDSDQPFLYDIRFSKKSFSLELYDTACPNQHWSTLKPDVVLLAFDISNRDTLTNLKTVSLHIYRIFSMSIIITDLLSGDTILSGTSNMVRGNGSPL
ncbi:hypothetical protein G4B84_006580 [Aspergillus flavus NRRL3357]|nr:uncharacterized protein G4B84_006580 [Aspergillus flavus NRRL3357]QMW31199.1 hypothetical protein G4B84_006580 [Aspergillus flavus NRRL3357]